MKFLKFSLILITLSASFQFITSFKLSCGLEWDKKYRKIVNAVATYNSYGCGFLFNESSEVSNELNVLHKPKKSDGDVKTLLYELTSVPVITPQIWKKFPNLTSVVFYNLSNSKINNDWFKTGQTLVRLGFLTNNFPILESYKFVNIKKIIRLVFEKCGIELIDKNAFAGLKTLKTLVISYNEITMLHPKVFVGLDSLETLNLIKNKITDLHPGIFESLTSLKTLRLKSNPIKKLDVALFRKLAFLETVVIEHSPLETIPTEIFKENVNLNLIYITDNNISRLSNQMFNHLTNLSYLKLLKNLCVSEIIDHEIVYTKILLTACSCEPVKKVDKDLILWNFIKFSGTIAGIIFVMLVIIVRYNSRTKITVKDDNNFNLKNGKIFF